MFLRELPSEVLLDALDRLLDSPLLSDILDQLPLQPCLNLVVSMTGVRSST